MRVLVCGSRHFNSYWKFIHEMDLISEEKDFDNNQPITIISGEARGADTLAKRYAEECGWNYEGYPADWNTYGKRAGPIRNRQMLVEGKPDLVVAFLSPDSRGTKNMIEQAKKAGIETMVVDVS